MEKTKPWRDEFFIRPNQTVCWQPPSYRRYENATDGPIFHIRIMREEERRYWSAQVMQVVAAVRPGKATDSERREAYRKAAETIFSNFVVNVENVPAWATGVGDDMESVTVTNDEQILTAISNLPAEDGEALDNAIWDYNLLKEGEIKNSERSSESTPGEQTTIVKPATAS